MKLPHTLDEATKLLTPPNKTSKYNVQNTNFHYLKLTKPNVDKKNELIYFGDELFEFLRYRMYFVSSRLVRYGGEFIPIKMPDKKFVNFIDALKLNNYFTFDSNAIEDYLLASPEDKLTKLNIFKRILFCFIHNYTGNEIYFIGFLDFVIMCDKEKFNEIINNPIIWEF